MVEATSVPVGPLVGENWEQVGELGAALLLSAVIGVEREYRQKDAGLRTHTLVGLGSALFMIVSKYGFNDVLSAQEIVVDPSRMAAQIVSGIGFIGAGLIFVRKESVRGLTTAASIWLVAAVGAAAGAGLVVLAGVATAGYLVFIAGIFRVVTHHLPRPPGSVSELRVRYLDGRGVLRHLLQTATSRGFIIDELSTESLSPRTVLRLDEDAGEPMVEVRLLVHGRSPVQELADALSRVDDVDSVLISDDQVSRD